MSSYNKTDIARLASQTNFLRDNLEKVLRLADVLQFISQNPKLKFRLVLKGGTAINLTIFDLPRLSVDIDLDFHSDCTREEMILARAEINEELLRYMSSQGYQQSTSTKNAHSLDSWVFFYQNSAGNRDNIKLEINYSMRQHIFEPCSRPITINFLADIDVMSLQPIELYGSKIKALIERHTCRDLYDVYNLLHSDVFNTFDFTLLRKIVVFYLAVGGSSAPTTTFDLSGIKDISFSQIRATLLPMLRKGDKFDFEIAKTEILHFLAILGQFNDNEIEFINFFNQKQYKPELLFDDQNIINRIAAHPMAIWKTK